MKHCNHCHIDIENPRVYCPLCQNPLSKGDGSEKESFPIVPVSYQKHAFLIRLLFFFSLIAIITTSLINYFHRSGGWWSVIVVASIAYFWIIVVNLLRTRNRLASISRSVVIICSLLFLIDYAYGFSRWSINYAIPATLFAAIASVVIVSIIRGLRFADFLIYLILTAIFALVPIIFLLTGLATVRWPSISCTVAGIMAFLAVAIFADQEVRSELRRRFHL